MTLSSTPLRYELLRNEDATYAILDHVVEAWASLDYDENTWWSSLPAIFAAPHFNYSFEYDYVRAGAGTSVPYSHSAYCAFLRRYSHITSLGYFASREQFISDHPELFI